MIRINLLPFREARRRENIRRQLSIFILTIIFLVVSMGYFHYLKINELKTLKKTEQKLRKDLKAYQEIIKRVNKLNRLISELQGKLKIINDLKSQKTGPVHLLDEIAMAVPRNQLWLTSLTEKNGILTLKGTAKNNKVVANFMRNLERSKYFKTVDLNGIQVKFLDKFKVKVSDFSLTCKTINYQKKKPKSGRRRKRRRR